VTDQIRLRALALADRHFIGFVVVTALAGYIWIYGSGLVDTPIRSDGFEYYVYLPALVVHHDPTLERFARDCCGGTFPGPIGIWRWPSTGRLVDRHTIGVAILVLPFFVVAHLLTLWARLPPDGFSLFYLHVSAIAGVFYLGAGLRLLKRLLERHFRTGIVLGTLVSIVWGTNLYHYATFEPLFSHVYSFFLFCCLLYLTVRWHAGPSLSDSFKIGIVAGLIVLVRPPNVLFLMFFPLYGVVDARTLRLNLKSFAARWPHIAAMVATACVIQVPQLALYRWAAAKWLINPYGANGGFHFGSPKIAGVLFSTQKGVLFWSPILLVSVVGLFVMRRTIRPLALATWLFVPLNVYVIASWDDWQFGASYGHRAFTDALPVMALSMAAGYDWLARRGWTNVVAAVAAMAIGLSVIQMIQYWLGIIPVSGTTWDAYRSVFLRLAR
jgi:hypothetical protein